MRKRYQEEFLTRRAIIQAIYSNICEFVDNAPDAMLQDEHMLSEAKFNREFFKNVLNKAIKEWQEFNISEYEQKAAISRCAQAVLRAAYAELKLGAVDKNIVIDEYVELSKQFCDNETGVINKILDVLARV